MNRAQPGLSSDLLPPRLHADLVVVEGGSVDLPPLVGVLAKGADAVNAQMGYGPKVAAE